MEISMVVQEQCNFGKWFPKFVPRPSVRQSQWLRIKLKTCVQYDCAFFKRLLFYCENINKKCYLILFYRRGKNYAFFDRTWRRIPNEWLKGLFYI